MTLNYSSQEMFDDSIVLNLLDHSLVYLSADAEFEQLCGYDGGGLRGVNWQNVVHPEIPRSALTFYERNLKSLSNLVLYKKVFSKLGSDYWFVSMLLQVKEGYLELCFKPRHSHLETVKQIYSSIISWEAEGLVGSDRSKFLGEEGFDAALKALGYGSYETLMKEIGKEEIRIRDASKKDLGDLLEKIEALKTSEKIEDRFQEIGKFRNTFLTLSDFSMHVDKLVSFHTGLQEGAQKITGLSKSFNIISLNTSVQSLRLQTRTIGTVAVHLQECSQGIASSVAEFEKVIKRFVAELESSTFYLAIAKLAFETQLQRIQSMVGALGSKETLVIETCLSGNELLMVRHACEMSLSKAKSYVKELHLSLRDTVPQIESIQQLLLSLEHIQNIGMMESAVSVNSEIFDLSFYDIKNGLEKVKVAFDVVVDSINSMQSSTRGLSLID